MSSTGVCGHCGCTDIDTDPSRGDAVCTNCGSVLEDQIIVSEVQFEEHASGASSVIGQFVSSDGTKSHSLGLSFPHGMKRESRTVTFDNGRRRIQQLGNQLKLNQHCIDTAFNFFKMAVNKRLTQGRKTTHVVAACLYLVCRTEGTPHMLLDFSDQLQVNVYSLGKTYLQLSRALCINIPAIDPCLYIPRFAHKLEFEEKTHEVSMTALRLVSRMKRDWMHTGRRPSGLCGAALLVAARMHDFSRNVKDVIKIAKVCDTTIRKRLNEFKNTPSSQLTIEEFQNIDLEEEQDPPSYTMGKLKAQKAKLTQMEEAQKMPELESEVMELQKEIENELKPAKPRGIWAAYAKMGDAVDEKSQSRSSSPSKEITRVSQFLEEETLKPCFEDGEDQKEEVRSDTQTPTPNVTKEDKPEDSTVQAPAHSLNMSDVVKNCITEDGSNQSGTKEQSGELDLTGIDDAELDRFLLSEDEIKIKTDLWMAENADYLQALKEKEERLAKEKEEEAKNPEKKKKRARKKRQPIQAATAEEAIVKLLQEKKISTKINYDVLNDLKCKKDIKMVAPVQVKSEPLRGSGPVINTKPILSRFRKSSKSVDSKDTEEPIAKKVKFEEVSVKPEVVVESGPVQYAQDIKEEVEVDEEEEEYDEEDELPSAAQLLGHNINREYEEHDLYDDD